MLLRIESNFINHILFALFRLLFHLNMKILSHIAFSIGRLMWLTENTVENPSIVFFLVKQILDVLRRTTGRTAFSHRLWKLAVVCFRRDFPLVRRWSQEGGGSIKDEWMAYNCNICSNKSLFFFFLSLLLPQNHVIHSWALSLAAWLPFRGSLHISFIVVGRWRVL